MENREFEYRFYNYDKHNIIIKLKELNAIQVHDFVKYEFIVFNHPLKKKDYIRLRNENNIYKLTHKIYDNLFPQETEITVDNFQITCDMLLKLGCTIKYKFEKLREKWIIDNTEIVFDMYPGMNEYMEIESNSIDELNKYTILLNLNIKNHKWIPLNVRYKYIYGFTNIPENLTFENVEEKMKPLIKKNILDFNKNIIFQKKFI